MAAPSQLATSRPLAVATRRLAATLLSASLLAACGAGPDEPDSPSASATDGSETSAEDALDVAVNDPREDSLYPQVGDPGVDALRYDLDLTWDPEGRVLDAEETLVFRATEPDDDFQLDLGEPLEVVSVSVDGAEVDFDHAGKDLVVAAPVESQVRYEVEIDYTGTPEPVEAPTARADFDTTGWNITEDGETWTMQEPFGAYSWYAVNDHPSDKALYDFTLTVPSPMVGVANGELVARDERDGDTTTRWRLDSPAAAYLVTVAFGDFEETEYSSSSGVPITTWVPADRPGLVDRLDSAPAALDWLEERLGPYPFDTLGLVVVDSESGMETQTMITLGDTSYTTSPAVVLHEMAHQWYGDTVTPNDWREVWMNEGMAMYLQGMWEAEQEDIPVAEKMDFWASFEDEERAFAGPPADADPDKFGSGNVYYSAALMWHELRERVGDEAFFEAIRAWPQEKADSTAGRGEFLDFIENRTGEELTDFFDAWLLGEKTPPRGVRDRSS